MIALLDVLGNADEVRSSAGSTGLALLVDLRNFCQKINDIHYQARLRTVALLCYRPAHASSQATALD
jgi:hypothetical protein